MEQPYLVFDCGYQGHNAYHQIHSVALIYFEPNQKPVYYKANIDMPEDYPWENYKPNPRPILEVYEEMREYWQKAKYYVCLKSATHKTTIIRSFEFNKLPIPDGIFFDLFNLAQKRLPELKTHSRESLVSHFDLFIIGDEDEEMNEALLSVEILNKLLVLNSPSTIPELAELLQKKKEENTRNFIQGSLPDADLDGIVYDKIDIIHGKKCLVTGNFEKYKDRAVLENLLITKGAIKGGLSKNLDYLIVGSGAGPSKINTAKELIASGAKLKIISEENLYEYLN